jgi:phage terminase small subunit
MPKSDGLTPKQQRFVEEYIVDLNATQAAIRAGYSQKTAQEIGSENLSKPLIAEAIAKLRSRETKAAMDRFAVTKDRVISEMARLAFANSETFFRWNKDGVDVLSSDDLTRDDKAAVVEVSQTVTESGGTIRVKLADKRAALMDLAKLGGWIVDRSDVRMRLEDMTDEDLAALAAEAPEASD